MNRKKIATRIGLSILVLAVLAGSVVTGVIPYGVRSVARSLTYGYDPDQIRQPMERPEGPQREPGIEGALADVGPVAGE
ncbi:MAG: hypothetical protein KDA27_12220 [Candidatus Eisenbacteria bacterium]|uniref:Uncharacterized protein n=1 Tax=Eiseniibacteriota bacterium TaxID=2212470 RepID=A0A956SDM4_UNCEI|nr:hypothetical protein [Candidatus Eisenbacteria bacterium]MCB9466183.1 hypothetical protein [Candidatus Eisenbacteria bacterium]